MTTRRTTVILLPVLIGLASAVAMRAADAPAAQVPAGILGNVNDLEKWTRYYDDTRKTEYGLGLIPKGGGNTLRLTFDAQLDGRFPTQPPTSVTVHAIVGALTNPNRNRTPQLTFEIDTVKKGDATTPAVIVTTKLDLTSRALPDRPAPGAQPEDLMVRLTMDEFTPMALADAIRINAFGFSLKLSDQQIEALHEYGRRVLVITAPSPLAR
jgi:hypothetical protein